MVGATVLLVTVVVLVFLLDCCHSDLCVIRHHVVLMHTLFFFCHSESQLGLFTQAETSGLFSIDQRSHVAVDEYKKMYRFVGRLLGKAIYDRHVLDVPLCTFMFKRILRQVPVLEDVKELDPVYHTSLQWMLDNTITGIIDETFSVLRDDFGSHVVVDLCPNGRNIEGKAGTGTGSLLTLLTFLTLHAFFTCSLFHLFTLCFSPLVFKSHRRQQSLLRATHCGIHHGFVRQVSVECVADGVW